MTNSKKTKRALASSVAALLLCFTMLLGTTFAWFTDNASTGVNTIQAGTLDIELLDANGESLEGGSLAWQKAEGGAGQEVLWEPGATYSLQKVTVKNNGNLALKYKVAITGIKGDAKLNEAIDWTITVGGETYSADAERKLAADASETLTISGTMKTTAGNQYQGLSITDVSITVLATQDTVEYDSATNQYDKDAAFSTLVADEKEFVNALKDENVTEIVISKDITYDWGTKSYENAENLVMTGKTICGLTGNETLKFVGYGSANNIKDVTLDNLKVVDGTEGDAETAWEHGYLEFDNLTANNVYFVDQIQLNGTCVLNNCTLIGTANQYAAWVNSGNVTFNKCSVQGQRSIKVHEAYGSDVTSVIVDGCTFTTSAKPGVVIGTVDSTTSITIKNSTFTGVPGGDQGKYFYESDTSVDSFNFSETNNTHN